MNRPTTPKEFKEQMEIFVRMSDIERRHIAMDDFMCEVLKELGYADGVNVFYNTNLWYS